MAWTHTPDARDREETRSSIDRGEAKPPRLGYENSRSLFDVDAPNQRRARHIGQAVEMTTKRDAPIIF
jgi:hypothetical protein